MSLRSGRSYKEGYGTAISSETMAEQNIADLMKMLIEDRQEREKHHEDEKRRLAELAEQERKQVMEQMDMLRQLVEDTRRDRTDEARAPSIKILEGEGKLVKLTEQDDIEAYLTTFERVMRAYEVKEERWAVKLAPQLTGKAQQAYAAMKTEDARRYEKLKEAILRCYDISEEMYRQRFRESSKKEGESVGELAVRLTDLLQKWTKGCRTVDEIRDMLVKEQLLSSLPTDVRIHVSERKPKTSADAAELADSYLRVRRRGSEMTLPPADHGRKPWSRDQRDHYESSKRSEPTQRLPSEKGFPLDIKKGQREGKWVPQCYTCGKKGHMSRQCPNNALFCGRWKEGLYRAGAVNGQRAGEILLDTGCSRTMVHSRFVCKEELLKESTVVRCAHGDFTEYPMAKVYIEVDGQEFSTVAAVSSNLPVDVLLGTDMPTLGTLIQGGWSSQSTGTAMAVTTRSRARREALTEETDYQKQQKSGVRPTPLPEVTDNSKEVWDLGSALDETVLEGGKREKAYLTRRQRREGRKNHVKEAEADILSSSGTIPEMSADGLGTLQRTDPTLEFVRRAADKGESDGRVSFVWKEGLLFRVVAPTRENGVDVREQLVLPKQCREKVMELAHSIPMAGHLSKHKTTDRVLQRFYWPALRADVAEYCRRCKTCQKTSRVKPPPAPLIPLPVMDVPFERIAMDVVGPLPRTSSGNKYVLVICDYATRYPEAVPMKSVDAEKVAEELVKMFARVGIPGEILTDQGSNFTSQLLAELTIHSKEDGGDDGSCKRECGKGAAGTENLVRPELSYKDSQ